MPWKFRCSFLGVSCAVEHNFWVKYCCDDVICVLSSAQWQLPAVSVLALLSWRLLRSEQYLRSCSDRSLLYLHLRVCASPGLRSAADLRVLREGGGIRQERDAARGVQGAHPARRGKLRAHQPAQEQPAALRRQRARRYSWHRNQPRASVQGGSRGNKARVKIREVLIGGVL